MLLINKFGINKLAINKTNIIKYKTNINKFIY